MLVAERFIAGLIKTYNKHPVSTKILADGILIMPAYF
jgi:hypothetical protein